MCRSAKLTWNMKEVLGTHRSLVKPHYLVEPHYLVYTIRRSKTGTKQVHSVKRAAIQKSPCFRFDARSAECICMPRIYRCKPDFRYEA